MSLAEQAMAIASKKDKSAIENLEKKISTRPQKKELEDKNILKQGEAPIQSAREALKKSQLSDSLNQKIASRPSPSELEQKLSAQKDKADS